MSTIVAASGAAGNWTSGGAWVGGVAPTAADDAQITALTTSLTIDSGAVCRGCDFTGFTGILTHNAGATLTIGDATAGLSSIALKFVAGMTYTILNATTSAISFISTSATVQSVDFAGKTTGNVTYNAASNGSWQMTGNQLQGATATLTFTKGTFDTNGQACTWGLFDSSSSNIRTLKLGASAITIIGANTTVFNIGSSNFTLNANTAVITGTGSTQTIFLGNVPSANWNDFVFSGSSRVQLNGATSCRNFSRIGSANSTDNLFPISTLTCSGTLTLKGNSAANRLILQSNTVGTARTITAAVVVVEYCDFQDITVAGAANWDLSAITGGSGDCGGNTGITFTPAASQTWQGTSGGSWATAAKWTSRIPLPQDDVIISSAFSAAQTITSDMPRLGKNISWAGSTGNPTWSMSTTLNCLMYGGLILIAGMTLSGTGGSSFSFAGRSTYTITSAGLTLPNTPTIICPGGTYTLADAFITGQTFQVSNGGFNTGNFAFTCSIFSSANSNTRSITLGTSVITITGANSWLLGTTTGLTFSGALSTINFTSGFSTLNMGSLSYGTVTCSSPNNTVIDSGTFVTLNISGGARSLATAGVNVTATNFIFQDPTAARTLTIQAGRTLFVTNINISGTPGKLMSIISSSAGTPATISKAAGIVSADYLSLKDSTATGGATFYAGANSTNVSGNSGWNFSAAPSSSMNTFADEGLVS